MPARPPTRVHRWFTPTKPSQIRLSCHHLQNNNKIQTLKSHTGISTNNYAELNAILLLLDWLAQQEIRKTTVNIFTDSTYVQDCLTDPVIQPQNFFLIQDIVHKASILAKTHDLSFKIPAHLDEKSMQRYKIPESTAADTAAKQARDTPQPFTSINHTRQQTLYLCVELLMQISNLLTPPHGSSSDRHSLSATANRASALPDPEIHQPLA